MTWPNFFIIGVSKAGTTSLYNYLNETENIFLIPKGKIHYFFPEEFNNDSNKEEYLSLVKNVKHEKPLKTLVCTVLFEGMGLQNRYTKPRFPFKYPQKNLFNFNHAFY